MELFLQPAYSGGLGPVTLSCQAPVTVGNRTIGGGNSLVPPKTHSGVLRSLVLWIFSSLLLLQFQSRFNDSTTADQYRILAEAPRALGL